LHGSHTAPIRQIARSVDLRVTQNRISGVFSSKSEQQEDTAIINGDRIKLQAAQFKLSYTESKPAQSRAIKESNPKKHPKLEQH
jgi:hypothetical protein